MQSGKIFFAAQFRKRATGVLRTLAYCADSVNVAPRKESQRRSADGHRAPATRARALDRWP